MITVRMVQTPRDRKVDVIAVRDRFMPTSGDVSVSRVRGGRLGMAVRMRSIDRDYVLIDVIAVLVMKMTVVEIVDVIFVMHRDVATALAVDVRVLAFMNGM